MSLSTSRQQFLAYESQTAEDIHYKRRGGVFISTCVCISLVLLTVIIAVLVGVMVYFITFFKLSQNTTDFWDETTPFAQNSVQSPDLRLPSHVVPSFYRLKIKADLTSWNFSGDVYITIRANKKVKEITLHSKNLTIKENAKLTEQIYEKVETLHMRKKRAVTEANVTNAENKTVVANLPDVQANENATEKIMDTNSAPVILREAVEQNNSKVTLNTDSQNNSTDNKVDVLQNDTVDVIEATTKAPVNDDKGFVDKNYTQVSHSSVRDIKISSINHASGDRLILTLDTHLKPNVDYILEISFEGNISNALNGFYKSTYTDENKQEKSLAVTQFEPTSARAAFPCFDEPGFKSKFEISIAHHKNMTALSNMNVAATEMIADHPDWEWTHFERSVNMSTYLVAYVLCDFKSKLTNYISKDNVTKPIRIWTRPELIKKAEYAAMIIPKLLEFYEEVFGLPYALDKLDLIAIPDFSSGAMENWGLITFRETGLLFDSETGVPRDKQNVAIDVAHELAHQWFGNLVTMQWWTDLWLNEGFATYIEYVGADHIEPGWNMFEDFTRDMLELLRSDALKNTSPVSRQVIDASEISQKFDEISYTKGATLIRMLNNTITEPVFRKGLVNYLNQWKYSNAVENDLWEAMSAVSEPQVSGRSLVKFMNSWTRQAGYPVLTVQRDYTTGNVHFQQKLFSKSRTPYKSMEKQLWEIPINYVGVNSPLSEWSTKIKLWLSERSVDAILPVNASEALYVNIGATGYYRVNYDQGNWELLDSAIKSGVLQSPVTKAQLINDAFSLAQANLLNYSYALGLTTCVINGEDSKMLWDMLLVDLGVLDYNMRATSDYSYFQDYIKLLIAKQLEIMNYGLSKPTDDKESLLVESLVTWECRMQAPRCLDWAKGQFQRWMDSANITENPIPPYLRSLVYHTAVKYGGRREFEFLWRVFVEATDPTVKTLAIDSLPATRDEPLINMLLEKSLTEIPKQYALSVWNVDPPGGSTVARRFLLNNFQRVYDTFTALDSFMFPIVLNSAFGFIATQQELDQLKSFALAHKEQLRPMSQTIRKLVEIAEIRIDWINTHAKEVTDWFKQYLAGGAANSTHLNVQTRKSESGANAIPAERSNVQNDSNLLKDEPKELLEKPKMPQEQLNVTEEQSKVTPEQQIVQQDQPNAAVEQETAPQEQSKVPQEQQNIPQEQPKVPEQQNAQQNQLPPLEEQPKQQNVTLQADAVPPQKETTNDNIVSAANDTNIP